MIDPKRLVCPICYNTGMTKQGFCNKTDKQRYKCKTCGYKTVNAFSDADHEIVVENVKLSKQQQRLQDLNRIQNKSFREHTRIENAVIAYNEELIKLFDKHTLNISSRTYKINPEAVGVIQFSDVHFNELVDLENNKYDFKVASARTRYFIDRAKTYFKTANISNVVVALTGDLMNSDSRLDELLNQATNRANATFLAVDILQQGISDLTEHFNVSVACVVGNEGRANPELGWSKVVASDNYDWTIFQCLRFLFRASNVNFIQGDLSELVINVAGQNLLLLHGHGSIKGQVERSVNQIVGRYALKGVSVDYVIFGHVHSARVGDNYSRSSSMVGANDYSEKALNLNGRASQNCYIFYSNGNRDGIKVDLQNTPKEGYDINDSLEAYNAKSAKKGRKKRTIFEIIV